LLAVLYWMGAHAVGVPVLPASQHGVLSGKRTRQDSLANELPGLKSLHVYTAISVTHGLFAIGTFSYTDMAESA